MKANKKEELKLISSEFTTTTTAPKSRPRPVEKKSRREPKDEESDIEEKPIDREVRRRSFAGKRRVKLTASKSSRPMTKEQ